MVVLVCKVSQHAARLSKTTQMKYAAKSDHNLESPSRFASPDQRHQSSQMLAPAQHLRLLYRQLYEQYPVL